MDLVLVEHKSKYPPLQHVQIGDDVDEVVLGRSLENAVCIKSISISRRHAVIRKTINGYKLEDQKAVNRLYVNGIVVPTAGSQVLANHDRIQLGLKATATDPGCEYFIYEITFEETRKRRLNSPTPEGAKQSRGEPGPSGLSCSNYKKTLSEQTVSPLGPEAKAQALAEAKAVNEKVELEKVELEKELADLREQQDTQRAKEEALHQQLLQLQDEQTKRAEELTKRLKDKETEFEEVKDEQTRKAKQMSEALEQREQELEEAKARQKRVEVLEKELKTTREEQERLSSLSAKIAVQEKIADLLEEQLQCSICNELMIQPKSFPCSHAFCSHCIDQWLRIKKECPVCRAHFTSATHNYLLSNLIEKAVAELSEESKLHRNTIIQEREEEITKKKTKKGKAKKRAARTSSRPPTSAPPSVPPSSGSTVANPLVPGSSTPSAAPGTSAFSGTNYRIPRIRPQSSASGSQPITSWLTGTPMGVHPNNQSAPRYPRTILLNGVPPRSKSTTATSVPQTSIFSQRNAAARSTAPQMRSQGSHSVNCGTLQPSTRLSAPTISLTACVNPTVSSNVATRFNATHPNTSITSSVTLSSSAGHQQVLPAGPMKSATPLGMSNSANTQMLSYHVTVGQIAYQFSLPHDTKFPVPIKSPDGFLHWVTPQTLPQSTVSLRGTNSSIPCTVLHVTKP